MGKNKNKNKSNGAKTIYFIKDFQGHKAGTSCLESDLNLNSAKVKMFINNNTFTYDESEMNSKLSKAENVDDNVIQQDVDLNTDIEELPKALIPEVNIINVPDEDTKQKVEEALEKAQSVMNEADEYSNLKKELADKMVSDINQNI